jgi:catechol 2,3-dioxygenase-like lactoylglutathione lyase family enzyme
MPFWTALGFEPAFFFGPEGATEEVREDSLFARLDAPPGNPVSVFLDTLRGETGAVVHFMLEEDAVVDEVADALIGAGFELEMEPTDQPWDTREMHARDPDGNLIVVVGWDGLDEDDAA